MHRHDGIADTGARTLRGVREYLNIFSTSVPKCHQTTFVVFDSEFVGKPSQPVKQQLIKHAIFSPRLFA